MKQIQFRIPGTEVFSLVLFSGDAEEECEETEEYDEEFGFRA
jgi:hypothetical protein